MTRVLIKFIGLILLLAGIKFLGEKIIFSSGFYLFSFRSLPASLAVLAIIGGVAALVFFRHQTGNLGWILLTLGIIVVFFNSGVFLAATSLWNFLLGLVAIAVGYQLLTKGRVDF